MNRKFKKCLITGATGSVGSYFIDFLIKNKKKVLINGVYRSKGYLDYLNKSYRNKVKLFKCDLQNLSSTKKTIKKINPDVVFHFASSADVRMSFENPIEFCKNNNEITINLLESLRHLKITPLVIISSTSEVYGNVSLANQPISENNYIAPINPYAVSKTFQDLISQVYRKIYGSKLIITRMFSYTNARRSNLFQSAFAKQIVEIENRKKKYLFHGNLKSKRTFMDIEDAMNAYWLCAKKGRIGEVYNIGGNKTISIKNFLDELIKISKTKIITKLNPKLLRPSDVNIQIPNSNKFKRDTGWKINISFKDSVKKLLNELRRN
jgi:GDP-4-dehydro-6-deoxy-D-mannose reductase